MRRGVKEYKERADKGVSSTRRAEKVVRSTRRELRG